MKVGDYARRRYDGKIVEIVYMYDTDRCHYWVPETGEICVDRQTRTLDPLTPIEALVMSTVEEFNYERYLNGGYGDPGRHAGQDQGV